jgi:predicted transcriptional regulator
MNKETNIEMMEQINKALLSAVKKLDDIVELKTYLLILAGQIGEEATDTISIAETLNTDPESVNHILHSLAEYGFLKLEEIEEGFFMYNLCNPEESKKTKGA